MGWQLLGAVTCCLSSEHLCRSDEVTMVDSLYRRCDKPFTSATNPQARPRRKKQTAPAQDVAQMCQSRCVHLCPP